MPVTLPSLTLAEWIPTSMLPDDLATNSQASAMLEAAYGLVYAETRQALLRATTTISLPTGFDPWGRVCVVLGQRPVVSVDSVTVIDGTQGTYFVEPARPDVVVFDTSPYGLISGSRLGNVTRRPSVTVRYTHGWDPNTNDGSLALLLARGVILGAAARMLTNPGGLASERVDDYAYTAGQSAEGVSLTGAERAALRVYAPGAGSVGPA